MRLDKEGSARMGKDIPVWVTRGIFCNLRYNTNTLSDLSSTLQCFKMNSQKRPTSDHHLIRVGENRDLRRGEEIGRRTKISTLSTQDFRTERGTSRGSGSYAKCVPVHQTLEEQKDSKVATSREREKTTK